MKIRRITLYVNAGKIQIKQSEFNCKETKSGFVIEKQSGFGGKTTRLKKEDILCISSAIREDLYFALGYEIWYIDQNDKAATKLIYNHAKTIAGKQASTAAKISKRINEYVLGF